MIGTEFAHAHAGSDQSLHLTLPHALAEQATRQHWAEPHYLVRTGDVPATLVMAYAPRDQTELAVLLTLLRASYDFATAGADAAVATGALQQEVQTPPSEIPANHLSLGEVL